MLETIGFPEDVKGEGSKRSSKKSNSAEVAALGAKLFEVRPATILLLRTT